jgi:hypothetical protein
MVRPRIFKRSHVDDPKLNKVLQDIDDEFSNLYAGLALATGPTGAPVTGPTGAGSVATGPTGAAITGPTGAGGEGNGPTGPSGESITGPTGAAGTSFYDAHRVASHTQDESWCYAALDTDITERFIVPVGAAGEHFFGHDNEMAYWNLEAWGWAFETAPEGTIAYTSFERDLLRYVGGSWVTLAYGTLANADTVDYWHVKYTDEYGAFELFN